MQKVEFTRLKKLDYYCSETYKMFRTNVQFCGDNITVIALTSCTPGEGKTSVSVQLAFSMAEDGKKVLFIDADIRKSVLTGRYKIKAPNVKGLTHFLSGQGSLDEILCSTNVENFDLVMAGPSTPNPSELLGGKHFKELVDYAREHYDMVIIDTAPLGSVIDSAIVARQCDGVIMVVAADEISYKFAVKVKEQLDSTGCKILGAVLNKVKIKRKSRYYGKYYGRYYGGEQEEKN